MQGYNTVYTGTVPVRVKLQKYGTRNICVAILSNTKYRIYSKKNNLDFSTGNMLKIYHIYPNLIRYRYRTTKIAGPDMNQFLYLLSCCFTRIRIQGVKKYRIPDPEHCERQIA
jgi:hypothetical protein